MKARLDVVILEDVASDAKLTERALRTAGIAFDARHVGSRVEFLRALQDRQPDVILADFNLPDLDGLSALKLARERHPETPVIIVTGTLADEAAVELLREGAQDYILKDRLSRLAPAVRRALAVADEARSHKAAEIALKNSELRYRRLFESAKDGILILEGDTGAIIDANSFLVDLLGYKREELIGKRVSELGAVKDVEAAEDAFEHLQKNDYLRYENLPLLSKAGKIVEVEVVSNAYPVDGSRYIQCNIRDIRERVAAQRLLSEQLSELRQFQRVTVDRELRMQELTAEIVRLKENGR